MDIELRDKIQNRVKVFSRKHPYLALIWATRVGKTIAALRVVRLYGGKWNIVVAQRQHQKQWKKEIITFDMEKYLGDIKIFCYQSLHKHIEDDVSWIFDEAQHMFTTLRWNRIASMKIPRALFLSPELEVPEIKKLEEHFNPFKVLGLSLETAIKKKILPSPTIILIPLTLDSSKITQAFTIRTGDSGKREVFKNVPFESRFQYLGKHKHLKLNIKCTEQQKYDLILNKLNYKRKVYKEHNTSWAKNAFLKVGLDRKRFLAQIKTPYVKKFLEVIKDERFICFTSSIKQCENLGGVFPNNIIHSKKQSTVNNYILDAFNIKVINSLFVVDMLTEGTNLTDVDIGIIIQLDSTKRRYVQKSGRIYLSNHPKQYIFYYEDTSDEKLVEYFIKGMIPLEFIKTVSFSDLISNYQKISNVHKELKLKNND